MKVIDVLIENIHVGDWHRRDMGEPLRRNWGTGSRDQNRPQIADDLPVARSVDIAAKRTGAVTI